MNNVSKYPTVAIMEKVILWAESALKGIDACVSQIDANNKVKVYNEAIIINVKENDNYGSYLYECRSSQEDATGFLWSSMYSYDWNNIFSEIDIGGISDIYCGGYIEDEIREIMCDIYGFMLGEQIEQFLSNEILPEATGEDKIRGLLKIKSNVENDINRLKMFLEAEILFCKSTEYEYLFPYSENSEKGCLGSLVQIGLMYRDGKGIERNYQKAIEWFRFVSEQDYADGQFNLGLMYYNGLGIERNYSEAEKWFRKANEQGHVEAQSFIDKIHSYSIRA